MKSYLFFLILFIGHCVCIEHDADIKNRTRRLQNNQESRFETHYRFLSKEPLRVGMQNNSPKFYHNQINSLGVHRGQIINKKTNNLVIAFEVKNMDVSSPRVTFMYNRIGKEPIRLTDAFFITYSAVTFTATIPNIDNLQLSNAYVYAYLHDNNANLGLGPGVAQSNDPVLIKAFNDLLAKLPENAKESLVIQARNFMNVFIQNNICDFGLNISN